MTRSSLLIALLGVSLPLALSTSTAEAAKGVKKSTANGQHIVTGVVTSITPTGNGGGTFQLRTANQHKKTQTATNVGFMGPQNPTVNSTVNANQTTNSNGNTNNHKFNVTTATQFHHQSGAVLNGSAINVGSHVRVLSKGNHAQNIQLLTGNHSMGNFMRHRTNAYHPHIPHHHKVH